MEGRVGFEPGTSATQIICASTIPFSLVCERRTPGNHSQKLETWGLGVGVLETANLPRVAMETFKKNFRRSFTWVWTTWNANGTSSANPLHRVNLHVWHPSPHPTLEVPRGETTHKNVQVGSQCKHRGGSKQTKWKKKHFEWISLRALAMIHAFCSQREFFAASAVYFPLGWTLEGYAFVFVLLCFLMSQHMYDSPQNT